MSALRILTLLAALTLAGVLGGPAARPPDPWPDPRPLARDTPAYRAPADPKHAADEQPPPREPAGPLALSDALTLALMRNPEFATFSWDVRASEARAIQAGKFLNPELDVRVWDLGATRMGEEPEDTRKRVVLSQDFEIGGKRRRRVDLAQTERELAGWDYEAKRIEVASSVNARFAAVLGAQRRVESAKQSAEFFEATRERVSSLVESGLMGSVEIHRVTRRRGLARIELQRAESELSAARYRLAAMWGGQAPQFTRAVGDLEQVRPIPDLDSVLHMAQQSPVLARLDAQVRRGEAALALARANRVPDVRFGAGVRWEEDFDRRDLIFDMEIDLPFFDRKQGDIREAQYGIARAHAWRKAAEVASSRMIAETYYALAEARARCITLRDDVVPSARATFEAFRLVFEKGARNLPDVLDAGRDLARAEISYADALVEYHQARANLEGIIGQSLR